MARRKTTSKGFQAIAGATLLSLGLLLLIANLDEVAAPFSSSYASGTRSLSATLELGLAAMRATHAYFFDPSSFQSGLQQILVSFWPLILVIVGALLLQVAFKGRFEALIRGARSSEGEAAHE
jgi:hypothetical protein